MGPHHASARHGIDELRPAAGLAAREVGRRAIAKVLEISTDELLGVKPAKKKRSREDPEVRRLRKTFEQALQLLEKCRRAVIRLVNSLVAAKAAQSG